MAQIGDAWLGLGHCEAVVGVWRLDGRWMDVSSYVLKGEIPGLLKTKDLSKYFNPNEANLLKDGNREN